MDTNGNCIPCSFNCLEFKVDFMKSAMQAVFLLVFTYADLQFETPLTGNL